MLMKGRKIFGSHGKNVSRNVCFLDDIFVSHIFVGSICYLRKNTSENYALIHCCIQNEGIQHNERDASPSCMCLFKSVSVLGSIKQW